MNVAPCHIAEVDVGDAAVAHGKDVSRVRVAVEKAELQQLPQPAHHPHLHVEPRG